MEKILLYMISGDKRESWNRAIELSKALSASLYALYIIDKEVVRKVSRLEEEDEIDTAVKMEEEGWKYLYHLEEKAVDAGINTALFLEEGTPVDILRNFVKEKKVDLLVVGHSRGKGRGGRKQTRLIEELVSYIPCPVLIEKEGG